MKNILIGVAGLVIALFLGVQAWLMIFSAAVKEADIRGDCPPTMVYKDGARQGLVTSTHYPDGTYRCVYIDEKELHSIRARTLKFQRVEK